ncbi:MAG: hypothetical protein ACXWI5_12295, partial [Croceibacterium sp.]
MRGLPWAAFAGGAFAWHVIEYARGRHTAAETFFKGLAASGWHTAAMTMRLLVEGGLPLEELRWPRPVPPGDRLSVES